MAKIKKCSHENFYFITFTILILKLFVKNNVFEIQIHLINKADTCSKIVHTNRYFLRYIQKLKIHFKITIVSNFWSQTHPRKLSENLWKPKLRVIFYYNELVLDFFSDGSIEKKTNIRIRSKKGNLGPKGGQLLENGLLGTTPKNRSNKYCYL